ncbi:15559_t:CDS:1 [Acaulospora morrowiae]|uniref:15559_t:CDS:1 n=1 Tax=Acaulospora morrowiae TaxID=94023 RepID=A0A9N9AWN3_9GLOM|nr:15559_t:CDS:1 [Acaulospora morrowiae]
MSELLAIARHVYLINPSTGIFKTLNSEDWSSTITAAHIPSTNKIYATTTFNNLWEISLPDQVRKISWDGWGTCNALVAVANDEGGHKLFAFCRKLWLVDDPSTGHCIDYLGGYTDVWARVNAATAVGKKIFATTSANNLWAIDTTAKEEPKKLGGGSDNWSTCKALVFTNEKLLAFCYGLWEINPHNGNYTPFFDGDSANSPDAKRSWLSVKSATVIGTCVYVVSGSQLLELDTVTKKVRELSQDDWGTTKALIAVNIK